MNSSTVKKNSSYPLKVYLNKDNNVIVTYTGAFYKGFTIQDMTCIITKKAFYSAIDELKKRNVTVIKYSNKFIKIELFKTEYRITVGDSQDKAVSVEKDKSFINWLLSIDLRKSKRISTLMPLSIQSENHFEYGAIIDISQGGFKIALNSDISPDSKLTLNIFSKDYPIGNVVCEVRRNSVMRDKFVYGLEITEISPKDAIILEDLISFEADRIASKKTR